MKLFVSYARVDKPLCKQVVERLTDVHDVWYDKRLHAGQDWWEEIQERLDWCEGFVYLLSPESVASEYCQKEFAIAANTGKHLFPVLIQARTEIPKSLSHIHFADLSQGMEDIITLMNALTIAERKQAKPAVSTATAKTPEVEIPAKDTSPNQALADAADAMEAENFDKAVFVLKQALSKKPEGRVLRMLQAMLTEAEADLEKQTYLREAAREYAPIHELTKRESTRVLACEEFAVFQKDFPDHDPENIAAICQQVVKKAAPKVAIPVPVAAKSQLTSLSQLPQPFAWIEIPQKGYSMSKYPVTNLQFAEFIKAGGYRNQQWWTTEGWEVRQRGRTWNDFQGVWETDIEWIEPRFWQDFMWNRAEQPVVGISWYEAIAFCLWLRDTKGEQIMLPSEEQWQYAIQANDSRAYPWGNTWNSDLCNNSVDRKGGRTSSITTYEGKGDSPLGVVDMAGNVWEWCLTDYENKTNNFESTAANRIVRGGAWSTGTKIMFRCDYRTGYHPYDWRNFIGFRIVHLH